MSPVTTCLAILPENAKEKWLAIAQVPLTTPCKGLTGGRCISMETGQACVLPEPLNHRARCKNIYHSRPHEPGLASWDGWGKGDGPRQPAGTDSPWQGSSDDNLTVMVPSVADAGVPGLTPTSVSAMQDFTLTESATSTYLPWGLLASAGG